MIAKARVEAFEGRWLEPPQVVAPEVVTVSDLWSKYEPISKRDNDSFRKDKSYAVHLNRHLGDRPAEELSLADVEEYRALRSSETTKRGGPPSSAQLDREVELLRRFLNHAVKCGRLPSNPLIGLKLLNRSNVRKVVVDEATFLRLHAAAESALKPILTLAFDTGMRKAEILNLRWSQFDVRAATIRLAPDDTKEEHHRIVPLTPRCLEAIRQQPRRLRCEFVFVNPRTGKPWREIRKMFRRACEGAELKCGGDDGLWFHDLRRSFVTKARRVGIAESVIMKLSGHRTRTVFERYNIVSEEDLREAVATLDATRRVGQEMEQVAGETGQRLTDRATLTE